MRDIIKKKQIQALRGKKRSISRVGSCSWKGRMYKLDKYYEDKNDGYVVEMCCNPCCFEWPEASKVENPDYVDEYCRQCLWTIAKMGRRSFCKDCKGILDEDGKCNSYWDSKGN